ncbi:AraC family transcriptional regulator [Mesorhizobium hawassense]|uniref:AraC family transcriptional regulator n=1 Tax=Mesorhizobium hawassense TaxID=1209954 RepID=A0A330HX06_9HYPH|nr:AraC family transcriptional regulator [Mesorhizobium hawassense]RAZ92833.1 AraC family transcriptional regulator [Mesorhizobium hawassense]
MLGLPETIRRSASISILPRHDRAGPILLSPIEDHRIVVHASRETWSLCMTSRGRHLRRQGDIDLVPAGEEGGYQAETACEALEIRLAPQVLEHAAFEMESGRRSGLDMRHIMKNERIVFLAMALESERKAGAPGGTLYADTLGLALATQLVSLMKPAASFASGLSPAQLKRLRDFIEAHIDRPLTIDMLAREAGASSSHLRQAFKQATGTTVHRYVVRRRLERARLLLAQGALSAAEVALAAGFSHQSHMARWMRRELGETPRSLFRKPST